MERREFLKFDESTNLCVYIFEPSVEEIKGVIQIAHGMAEHLGRYTQFANHFNKLGCLVVGSDHYAHGLSVDDASKIGVIKDYDFMEAILLSIKKVYENYTKNVNGSKILFAHSMGSMAAQRYIELYPDDFEKVIISGTDYPGIKYSLSKLLTKSKGKVGQIVYSDFINNLGVGGFNAKFKNENTTDVAWLSNVLEVQQNYINDPLCGQMFPVNYYYSLACMLTASLKKENRCRINRNLKLMIISGKDDPVGAFGNGPVKLASDYLKMGLNVRVIIYDNARHELLNELPDIKTKVYDDLTKFIID